MRRILIIIILLAGVPAWPMDSQDLEEIIKILGSTGANTKAHESTDQNGSGEIIVNKNAALEGKDQLFSSSPDEALLKSGIQLFEASLFDNSRRKFEEIRNNYPDSPYRDIASIWLSKINIKLNNFSEAINVLKTINNESGEYPAALSSLGDIYLKTGDENSAIEYFYRIASLFPDHELADDSLISISRLYLKNNKGSQALEAAIRIIKDYKDRETLDDAYFLIAQIFEKDLLLKDFSIARKIYQIFLKKAKIEKAPGFYRSPLIETAEDSLRNIEITYYGKAFVD